MAHPCIKQGAQKQMSFRASAKNLTRIGLVHTETFPCSGGHYFGEDPSSHWRAPQEYSVGMSFRAPPPCHPERSEESHTDCARSYGNSASKQDYYFLAASA
jgi:hypothetical protein